MRERVGHERTGRERIGHGRAGRERTGHGRWGRPRGWGSGPGPRPVRPGLVPPPVRPPEAPRPVGPPGRPVAVARWVERIGLRVLARRPVGPPRGVAAGTRRVFAGLALLAASTTAVLALGLLARAAAPDLAPAPVSSAVTSPSAVPPPAPVVVVAEAGETVWEVVDRVAPGASGAERAALAERIVVDNGLGSVRLQPGQVLRVSSG